MVIFSGIPAEITAEGCRYCSGDDPLSGGAFDLGDFSPSDFLGYFGLVNVLQPSQAQLSSPSSIQMFKV